MELKVKRLVTQMGRKNMSRNVNTGKPRKQGGGKDMFRQTKYYVWEGDV